jgi:hypothetical protein
MVKSLQKKEVKGAASIHQHYVELDVFYDGIYYQRMPFQLWNKVQVVSAVEGDGDLKPSMVLGGGGTNRQDVLCYEFLLSLGLIPVGVTKNIVDLLVHLGEVALGILGLLFMIGRLGHLENLICKTLEVVIVLGLVLSLGVENANAI